METARLKCHALPIRATCQNQSVFKTAMESAVAGPNAVANAIRYAKFRGRSHRAVIRVDDDVGNVTHTQKHAGRFQGGFVNESRRRDRPPDHLAIASTANW